MAILADVTLPDGGIACKVYVSPRYINANRGAGFYVLDYLVKRGGAAHPVLPEQTHIEFRGGGRFKAGVIYDRQKSAHENVYADLAAKLLAGELPWLSNVRNEDGSQFSDPMLKGTPEQRQNERGDPPAPWTGSTF